MPVSRALRRLLRIRELQEEQSRAALESVMGELSRLEKAVVVAAGRDRQGRQLVSSSAQSSELPDRLAGLEESRAAMRQGKVLKESRDGVKQQVEILQQSFLTRQVERRQAETLIEAAEAMNAIEAERRGQQALDEWHRSRTSQANRKPKPCADTQGAGSSNRADRGDQSREIL